MERCGFFNAELTGDTYDRVYLADQFAAYFASFIGNGVYAKHSNQLQVMAEEMPKMQVRVPSGQAWINGYWYENTDDLYLPIEVADGVLSRMDSIVLRWGTVERDMWLAVAKGTPVISNPIAPEPKRSPDYHELRLATISIPKGATSITQAQITDTRADLESCGWVTGVIDQIDTTTLFTQFETYFAEFKEFYEAEYASWTQEQKAAYLAWISGQRIDMENWTEQQKEEYIQWYNTHIVLWQSEFDTWFNNMKGQLSEDAAGNLQLQVNDLEDKLDGYTNSTTTFSSDGNMITQLLESGETIKTTFVDSLHITQEWFSPDGLKLKHKDITFNEDGSVITEQKGVN